MAYRSPSVRTRGVEDVGGEAVTVRYNTKWAEGLDSTAARRERGSVPAGAGLYMARPSSGQ